MKKIISLLILCCLSIPVNAADSESVNKYVNKLVQDGLDILRDNALTQDQKVKETKEMILDNLDVNWMAKFTLGSYRKILTPEQINQFTKIYGGYVSKAYADLVKSYNGQEAKVVQVTPRNDSEFMVDMTIIDKNSQGNIKVSYLIRQIKDQHNNEVLKVSDVITEGVSLIRSQQSEFTNIISGKGFDTLLTELAKKS